MTLLEVSGLVKRFGGLTATDGVNLTVEAGEVHAVIGPNGAGKTTLINQLSGELLPDAGSVHFAGRDITTEPVFRRALAGIGRSYQITSVFPEFSVLINVVLAAQAHAGHSFSFWRPIAGETALIARAREALAQVGLASRADTPVAALAHGERRQLEMAMTLATQPKLLLLDEPMAGMSLAESERLVRLLATAQGTLRHPARRARHGRRVQARRPHHGAGLRPRHRVRATRRHSRESRSTRCVSRRAGPGGLTAMAPSADWACSRPALRGR